MMTPASNRVWRKLHAAGLVDAETRQLADELTSPWYIKGLLAFSGWLASLFFLVFLGVTFDFAFREPLNTALCGAGMLIMAFGLFRTQLNEFLSHAALVLSLSGQFLLAWAAFDVTQNAFAWLMVAGMQLLLMLLFPNVIHRLVSAFLMVISSCVALDLLGCPFVAPSVLLGAAAWLWLHEYTYPQYIKEINALGYGLLLGLVVIACVGFYADGFSLYTDNRTFELLTRPWFEDVLTSIVLLVAVVKVLAILEFCWRDRLAIWALVVTLLVCVATIKAPGISLGWLILLLGFNGSNRVLIGLGISALLIYLSHYYYQLDTSLMVKSQSLLCLGLVLLGARWSLLKLVASPGASHE
ncbi:DUF4401 domain-containing protein [Shewanella sp. NIFS-20-20]|uniref:DUF4401 domain-containing protein n=1 Tax=Shewanella sp. NIFS-20-20 TaxID=2853806 RepID=UPI001C46E614|nr:DUF4401 domain-containing protein [Shewanella sp. NIFS-20-20]MBV7315994.1 DUF4401 domain-containing protein [Shewanella sp. NIFS-20-20]